MRLQNKSIIITGSGSGIGRSTAIACAREGARLALVDIDEASLAGTEAIIKAENLGSDILCIPGDVTKEADVIHFIDATLDRYGRIDGLHNNAGITGPSLHFADYSVEQFNRIIEIDLKSVFLGMKYGIRAMEKQKSGSIVNTSSGAGLISVENSCAYIAAKHGILGLCKSAALEYAHVGLRFNAVCPGFTRTELLDELASRESPDNPDAFFEMVSRVIPARRMGKPDEVASAVVFLLSDESEYINGSYISIDGGLVIS